MRVPQVLLLATLLIASCDRPECQNTNPILLKFAPETKEYKAELIRQLNILGPKHVSFWIDKYVQDNGSEEMTTYIQGDGLCAKATFDILNAKGLNNFKKVKGVSYHGAELKNPKYTIDSTSGNYRFIFNDVGWISD